MHTDVGAIIGIALASSVLIIALLLFCILHARWPCCKSGIQIQPQRGSGNRRVVRPSASSRSAFANFDFHGSSRSVRHLSAVDLHNQNHFYSSTGIVNPVWQMHCTCHPSALLTASQQGLNYSHYHPTNSCQLPHHHNNNQQVNRSRRLDEDNLANATEPSGFQYFSPQLQSTSESPPPYPGSNTDMTLGTVHQCDIINSTGPPPYSPKR